MKLGAEEFSIAVNRMLNSPTGEPMTGNKVWYDEHDFDWEAWDAVTRQLTRRGLNVYLTVDAGLISMCHGFFSLGVQFGYTLKEIQDALEEASDTSSPPS